MKQSPNPSLILFFIFIFGFFSLTSLLNLYGLRRAIRLIPESQSWPTTEGIVTESRVAIYDINDGPHKQLEFQYSFDVNGHRYTSTHVRFGQSPGWDHIVSMYPAGKHVRVYYQPSNPQVSILELSKNPPTDAEIFNSTFKTASFIGLTLYLLVFYFITKRRTA